MHSRAFALGLAAALASLAAGASLFACSNESPPGPITCLGSIAVDTSPVAAGASAVVTLTVANPDVDLAATVTVVWSVDGGGALDQPQTSISLVPQTDPLGNPGGVAGSTTNTFHARGPSGSYAVHATVDQGGGCLAASYAVPVAVSGAASDAGDAGDAGDAD